MEDKDKQKYNSDVSFILATQELERNKKVSERVPDLKKVVLIIIGLSIVGLLYTQFFRSYISEIMGIESSPAKLQDYLKSIGFIILIILGISIMNTKNVKYTKLVVGSIGLIMLFGALSSLLVLDFIGVGITVFIAWWIYNLYESIDTLN